MVKPKILLVYDVPGWGGEHRALMLKEYLSEDFDFTLVNEITFRDNLEQSFNNFDIYYLSYHTMLARGKFVERLKGKKIVTMVTGAQVIKEIFAGYGEKISAEMGFLTLSKHCTAIFANNHIALKELRTCYQGITHYTPRGVDEKIFIERYPYPIGEKFKTCFVGKPVLEKGLKLIIKPATNLTNSELIKNTRNWTNALSLEEMSYIYSNTNVYLVASTIDGTPNSMLEAASCSRPIIANAIGNAPHLLKDGKCGFLVTLKVDDYVEKIWWMIRNREKARQMGLNARQRILDSYTWSKVVRYEKEGLQKALEA